ncbi:LysE family transporter [Rhizobium sp. Leaf391]|uniref:LysE family translocator n=1 Tax=Rhizobium sp. Leaf391 TaxID=1736360 RepID=UPI0009EAC177|nr:LysE family transporter [Rhizobium sp. Leaf391]
MSEIACLLAGAGAGLSIAAPFGPTSMMCVERTLADGMRAGIASGLGVATVHLTYSTLAFVGGMQIMSRPENASFLAFAAGLLLLYFAARLWRRQLVAIAPSGIQPSFSRAYCSAIGFGFLNPVTPALCAAALAAFSSQIAAPGGLLPIGVFLGSFAWWLLLSIGLSRLRPRLNLGALTLANRGAAILLAIFGLSMLLKSFAGLSQVGL